MFQSAQERNYHIFYQIIAGVKGNLRQSLRLGAATDFHYLDQSGCTQIPGQDDAAEFEDVLKAMRTLQFSEDTIEAMLRIIAAVLHLGNVQYEAGDKDGESQVSQDSVISMRLCASLLGCEDLNSFRLSLTEKMVQMGRGSFVAMKFNATQAVDARDTLAKYLYSNLFDWTVRQVNLTLKTSSAPFSIGILDIFGFEVFELNTFEQLCINYANEALQMHFNEVIFDQETQVMCCIYLNPYYAMNSDKP